MDAKATSDRALLWAHYAKTRDTSTRENLILSYAPMVPPVAARLARRLPAHVNREDLVSCGFLGLIQALERYAPDRGVRFEAYAMARIRGAMLDGLRALDWVPAHVRQRVREMERAYLEVEAKLGRTATEAEVSERLGLSMEEFQKRLKEGLSSYLLSLEDFAGDEEGPNGRTTWSIVDDTSPPPEDQVQVNELRDSVAKAIDSLPEKERLVVQLYYYRRKTTSEIARVLGVSQSRVSQLHKKALLRLRTRIQREQLPGFEAPPCEAPRKVAVH
jgi:RNA polymerase sigma factor for flagellar operon FliA